jgi:UDP-3-O-[3-hydroxymyristoyl] glucosamine N-acyltransferase
MQDTLFYQQTGPMKLGELADTIGCTILNKERDKLISAIKPLSKAGHNDLSFLSNRKYLPDLKKTKAAACIIPADLPEFEENHTIFLKSANPYFAYAKALDMFYHEPKTHVIIEKSAHIHSTAKIGKNTYIGHNVVIEDNVCIGEHSFISSGTYIGQNAKIGNRARIDSNVSISHSIIGDDVVILPGARIGQDGFGFATDKGIHKKIYHIGRVIIGNDVEIGANSCIDRGSMNDTIIEDYCRIDNLVQIGHNAHIKRGAILVAQVGIAGSSVIGSYCALGGQVGVAGHVNITDQVQIAGQGGVIQDITSSGIYGGTPAVPIKDWHRQTITIKKLINKKHE